MGISDFARRALGIGGAAAMLSGCGGPQTLIGQSVSMQSLAPPPSNPAGERVLYRFKSGSDGSNPNGALVDVNRTLLGTAGVIFSIGTSGSGYTVLHRYSDGQKGGASPGQLTYENGEIYGTTVFGGDLKCRYGSSFGCGTVFKMDPSGSAYKVLYRFTGMGAGIGPATGLLVVNGALYGATAQGGRTSPRCYPILTCGTLYAVNSTSGKESVLHHFHGHRDGYWPISYGMVDVNGALYGTTILGGTTLPGSRSCGEASGATGCGTIFKIMPSGDGYQVVYRFKGRDAGAGGRPNNVINVNGTLYGTTVPIYGAPACGFYHWCETIFKFDVASRREKDLYRFQGGHDGSYPNNLLAYANGALYGTTARGGESPCPLRTYGGAGCGTVFKFDLASGRQTVLYRFKGGRDGAAPSDGVIYVNGELYGVTPYGGGDGCGGRGCGTVFELKP